MESEDGDHIDVLVVDDEHSHAETTALFLEKVNEAIRADIATSGATGLEELRANDYDCVVSDYDMPGGDGIDFLESVRDDEIEIPFILFTGKGSEEIASEAISSGVTEYLQKQTGTSQYHVLANRIENAVQQHRARRQIEETTQFYGTVLRHSSDFVMIVDDMGEVSYISPAVEGMLGYTPQEVKDMNAFAFVHPEDEAKAANSLEKNIREPAKEHTVEFRAENASGEYRWLEVRGRNLFDDPVISGIMVNVRDITGRKEREQALEQEKSRLSDLTEHLSHDIRNQLNLIDSRIELAQSGEDGDHLQHAHRAVSRVVEMLDKTMALAESGQLTAEPNPTSLERIAEDCWYNVGSQASDLVIEGDLAFKADEERLRGLLENLLLNALEHAGDEVTIRIGPLTEGEGFYVADNGRGIPTENPAEIFQAGYSTADESPGLGLRIVSAIAEAHEWEVRVTESDEGGARFEISNVTTVN